MLFNFFVASTKQMTYLAILTFARAFPTFAWLSSPFANMYRIHNELEWAFSFEPHCHKTVKIFFFSPQWQMWNSESSVIFSASVMVHVASAAIKLLTYNPYTKTKQL